MPSAYDKKKLLAEHFFKNSNLDDSGISLPAFASGTNMKLHNISVTPKLVRKVITNLDLPNTFHANCVPVVFCRTESNCLCILAVFFYICLQKSHFSDCWKISSVDPVYKNVGKWSTGKYCDPLRYLSLISKIFEKLVGNGAVE